MTLCVLDASALLVLLLAEQGHERVRASLPGSAITTVNLSEVVGHYTRNGVDETGIRRVLDPLPLERVPFDEDLAYAVGLLLPATRPAGLSFGDRACLALARRLGIKALTADRAWRTVAKSAGVEIELVR